MQKSINDSHRGMAKMRKQDYIQLLVTDNQTTGDKQPLYNDVIDCVDIALSQTPSDYDIDSSIGLEELFKEIEQKAKENQKNNIGCVGPFEAAELIANKLGTKYERVTRKAAANNDIVNLEDFF